MKITKSILFNIFIASAVIGLGISYSKIYLFHIILVLFIIFSLINNKFKIDISEVKTKRHYFLIIMFLWYILSTLWSLHKLYSIMYLGYLFFGIFIVYSIVYKATNEQELSKLFKILAILFSIEIFICLLEGLGIFRYPISPFSKLVVYFGREIDGNLLINTDSSVLNELMHMPTGFRWNTNNLAIIMNLLLPFVLFHKNNKVKIIFSVLILFIIYSTSSRGNLIAFLIIITLYFGFFLRKNFLTLAFLLLTLIPVFLTFSKNSFLVSKLENSFEAIKIFTTQKAYGENSLSYRQKYIENGINALLDTYGLGVGAGNSGNEEYHQNVLDKKTGRVSLHNFWVEILVDGGVIFAIFFYIWYISLIISLYKVYLKSRQNKTLEYFSASCSLSLAGLIFSAIAGSSVIYEFPMWILFGFSIAVINLNYNNKSINIQ